jgi:hypothetical protein
MPKFPPILHPALFVALTFLGLVSAHADEWLLDYDVTEELRIESTDADTPSETTTHSFRQFVALAPDHLVVKDDRQHLIRDFTRRRYHLINPATATYDTFSLFAFVDFIEAELANRNALGAGMRAAAVDAMATQFSRFDNETNLRLESLPHPQNPGEPVIEETAVESALEFRHDGNLVARFTPSNTSLPPHLQPRLASYLAYTCSLHPKIRRRILASGQIPQELRFTSRTTNRLTTTTLRLRAAAPSPTDTPLLPPNVTLAHHPDDPVLQLLAYIHRAEQTTPPASREETLAFVRSALDANRPLDALLALIEHQLQTGESIGEELRRHRKRFDSDPACRTYRGAFDQSSREACEASLAANATLDRSGLTRAHMLELQRANHLARLGRAAEARESFLLVLRANPFHTGALHDLGALLARSWDHPKAWLCWDTARRLYPRHPMLKSIAEREQQLLSRYPEFF